MKQSIMSYFETLKKAYAIVFIVFVMALLFVSIIHVEFLMFSYITTALNLPFEYQPILAILLSIIIGTPIIAFLYEKGFFK